MGIYARHIFPRLLDWSLGTDYVSGIRAKALAPASGAVLEIGFGTGLNLAHYPRQINKLTALDSEKFLKERVQQRIDQAGIEVETVQLDASGSLPFPAQSFDTIVTTFTLCSIAGASAALAEMRRVLKPSGRYLFLEHGQSADQRLAHWQDRLNPIQKIVGVGCNLNRPIDMLIKAAGFEITSLERFRMPGAPKVAAELYLGCASIA